MAQRILGYVPPAQTNAATRQLHLQRAGDENELGWDLADRPTCSALARTSTSATAAQANDGLPTSPLPADGRGSYVTGGNGSYIDGKSAVVVHNRVWSPNVVSTIRAGWSQFTFANAVPAQPLRGVGIPGVDASQPMFSQVNITGFTRRWACRTSRTTRLAHLPAVGRRVVEQGRAHVQERRAGLPARDGLPPVPRTGEFVSEHATTVERWDVRQRRQAVHLRCDVHQMRRCSPGRSPLRSR